MGKKLAIQGHDTRGNEVIELLKMMGGNNCFHLHGLFSEHAYYFIGGPHNDEIRAGEYMFDEYAVLQMIGDMCFFTLEEFLEKFPFKVGNFVRIPEYESEVRICKMKWCPVSKHIEYMVCPNDEEEWFTANELLDYNDNPNEIPKNKEEKKINQMSLANCDLDEVEIVLGDKFELKIKDGKYYAVRKKSRYPKTYDECCEILNANEFIEYELMVNFPKLINARNAYWKIAGEQMELGKPWEPDWSNDDETKFCIYTTQNIISLDIFGVDNRILAFPTEEMRDAFYKNFDYLIKACKELL